MNIETILPCEKSSQAPRASARAHARRYWPRCLGSVVASLTLAASTFAGLMLAGGASCATAQEPECVTWPRVLPPEGIEIPAERKADWQKRIEVLEKKLETHRQAADWADVAVLVKACRLAIEHREFYQAKDFAKCDRLLKLAEEAELGGAPKTAGITTTPGLSVRGYSSMVDDSVQPVGMVVPEKLELSKKVPLVVWLHGRGDKATDLHFICDRLDKKGEVAPPWAITLHAFGRQCVGYKNAASTDVMEAIDFACSHYPIDRRRIVLMGFSMGGAGAWLLSAHFTDRFVAASPGAGFAETARYQRLTPDKYPPQYVQTLWSINDVPGYTRNLFNIPVIAYSGEVDKQIQAARVMEEAFQAEGRQLQHLIGPGMGHKYHPDVLKDLLSRLEKIAEAGKPESPSELFLQTRHWRFAQRQWIGVDGFQEPYADTRVDARREGDQNWQLVTKNVSRLVLTPPAGAKLTVDGTPVAATGSSGDQPLHLARGAQGQWQTVQAFPKIRKHPGLSGPIDDAFTSPFLIVTPTGKSSNPAVEKWVQCELAHAVSRWKALMRGAPRVCRDQDVTAEDVQKYHLILWGTPESNSWIAKVLKQPAAPVAWSPKGVSVGSQRWDADAHVPVLIMPNPEAPERYVVINSGLTFREAHDRTNSLQNPQLPDWAVISLDEPPSAERPGRIAAAGFFNDQWQLDAR
jgi:dienelactone hydrolase